MPEILFDQFMADLRDVDAQLKTISQRVAQAETALITGGQLTDERRAAFEAVLAAYSPVRDRYDLLGMLVEPIDSVEPRDWPAAQQMLRAARSRIDSLVFGDGPAARDLSRDLIEDFRRRNEAVCDFTYAQETVIWMRDQALGQISAALDRYEQTAVAC